MYISLFRKDVVPVRAKQTKFAEPKTKRIKQAGGVCVLRNESKIFIAP